MPIVVIVELIRTYFRKYLGFDRGASASTSEAPCRLSDRSRYPGHQALCRNYPLVINCAPLCEFDHHIHSIVYAFGEKEFNIVQAG